MENFERNTYQLEIEDIIQYIENLTQEEIKFVRHYFNFIKVDIEEDEDIVFSTMNSNTLGNLIIDIVRKYISFSQKTSYNR